jgi:hypothetical protein
VQDTAKSSIQELPFHPAMLNLSTVLEDLSVVYMNPRICHNLASNLAFVRPKNPALGLLVSP